MAIHAVLFSTAMQTYESIRLKTDCKKGEEYIYSRILLERQVDEFVSDITNNGGEIKFITQSSTKGELDITILYSPPQKSCPP